MAELEINDNDPGELTAEEISQLVSGHVFVSFYLHFILIYFILIERIK